MSARPGRTTPPPADGQLVGRATELRRIRRAVLALRQGRSSLVTITGPPGTGRTALLEAAVEQALECGLAAALARCTPAEVDLRYGVVSQLTAALGTTGIAESLGEADIVTLCGQFQTLARDRPLLIAVDDTEWADPASREWVRAMAHRRRHVPIALVQVVPTSAAAAGGDVLVVLPLREPDVRELAARTLDQPVGRAFAAAATTATGGRPAVLRPLLERFARTGLPADDDHLPTLHDLADMAVAERAARAAASVSGEALDLLRATAVAGDALDDDLVAVLAGLSTAATGQARELLAERGLKPCPRSVRHSVLAAMTAPHRLDLARRAAELGHRAAVAEPGLADLVLAAPPIGADWVPGLLRREAGRRRDDGDRRGAAALLARALREPMGPAARAELLIELGLTEVLDNPVAGDRRLRQVLLMSPAPDLPVVDRAADLLLTRGDAAAAQRATAIAYQRREPDTDAPAALALTAIGRLAQQDCGTAPLLPVLSFADPGLDLTYRTDDPVHAGVLAWDLAARGRELPRVRALARLALAPAPPGGSRLFGPRIAACRALLCADDLTGTMIGLDELITDARCSDARAAAAQALLLRGRCEIRRGHLGRAAEDLAGARAELPADACHPQLLPAFVALEVALHLARDTVPDAERALSAALPDGADRGVSWAWLLFGRARVSLALADPPSALSHATECGRVLLARGWAGPAALPWRELTAAAHLAAGDEQTARTVAADALRRAYDWGDPHTIARARRVVNRIGERRADGRWNLLSADERRIAELAARGLPNAYLAEVLGLSLRAVELRLTKVYRKLAMSSRGELAAIGRGLTVED